MTKIHVEKLNSMTGHRDAVYALEDLPDDSRFFSAAGDGMVVLWDLKDPDNGQLIARVPNSVYAITRDPETDFLLVGHNYEGVHVIDWKERKEVGNLRCTEGAIYAMALFRGKLLVGDSTGTLRVIDFRNRSIEKEMSLTTENIRSIAVNEGNDEVAIGTSINSVYILDLHSLKVKKRLSGHSNSVFSLKYSPDNRYILSVGRDAHIRIWDTENDYSLDESIIGHMYTINNIEFSPDGKHFVTCSMDKSIKVWDAATFKLLKVIDRSRHAGHGTSVNRLLWKTFNHTLLSASDDRTISSWQLEFT